MGDRTPTKTYEKTIARRGRPKTARTQHSWLVRRLVKTAASKEDGRLIKEAAASGLNSKDVGAMGVALWAQLQASATDMELHHFFGTATKLIDTLRKLLELQAIEASEVPGTMIIDVTAPPVDDDAPPDAGDEIPIS